MAAPKEPPQVNIPNPQPSKVIPFPGSEPNEPEEIREEKDSRVIPFPGSKSQEELDKDRESLEIKPTEITENEFPELDGLDYIEMDKDPEEELEEEKATERSSYTRKKPRPEEEDDGPSPFLSFAGYLVRTFISNAVKNVNTALNNFQLYRRVVSEPVRNAYKSLGNLVTKTSNLPGVKQALVAGRFAYNTVNTAAATVNVARKGVERSIAPTAAVTLLSGGNPLVVAPTAIGVIGLNSLAAFSEYRWGAFQPIATQRNLFDNAFRSNPFFVEFRRMQLAEKYQAKIAATTAINTQRLSKLADITQYFSKILINNTIPAQRVGSLLVAYARQVGMSQTRALEMLNLLAKEYNIPAARMRDIFRVVNRTKLLAATDDLGAITPATMKSILSDTLLTKMLRPISGILSNTMSANIIRFARYLNWAGWGGLLGGAIGLLVGNPLLGAAIGAGSATAFAYLRNKMPQVIGNLGVAKYFKALMASPALRLGMSYAAMVDSGNWAAQLLRDLRKAGIQDTYKNYMYGYRGILTVANAGFFAFNAVSLSAATRQVTIWSVGRAAPWALNRLGFQGLASGFQSAGVRLAGAAAFSNPLTIAGGIIGTGIGTAVGLALGGGGLAVAGAITGGAIGGLVGTAAGAFIGGSVSFGTLAVPAAAIGNFIGSTIGSLIGAFVGLWQESQISQGFSQFMKVFSLFGTVNLLRDLDWRKPWNISSMIALIFAMLQLINVIDFSTDGGQIKTDILTSGSGFGELREPIQRLSYLYNFSDPESQLIFASTEIDSQSSQRYIDLSNPIVKSAFERISSLEVGFWGFKNKFKDNFDNNKFNEWQNCKKDYPGTTILCDSKAEINSDSLYWATDLVLDVYTENNLYSKKFNKTTSPEVLRNQFIENNSYISIKDIEKISELKQGMVVFLSNGENDLAIHTGIVSLIGRDYIQTFEANTKDSINYYTVNFNGRHISASNELEIIGFGTYE